MIRNATYVRGLVIRAINTLRLQLTQSGPEGILESDAILALGGAPFTDENALQGCVEAVMVYLGGKPPAAAPSRFSRAHRQVARTMKPPRGMSRAEWAERQRQEALDGKHPNGPQGRPETLEQNHSRTLAPERPEALDATGGGPVFAGAPGKAVDRGPRSAVGGAGGGKARQGGQRKAAAGG